LQPTQLSDLMLAAAREVRRANVYPTTRYPAKPATVSPFLSSKSVVEPNTQTAIFGGGCFWCLEAVFQRVPGVKSVESGYMGGHVDAPTYRQVCSGDTGHVEVVRISFDPAEVSYRDLLEVLFAVHDPTTLNRQGNDVGTQYRSVIFYQSEEQRRDAEQVIAEVGAAREWPGPVVTSLEPAKEFFVAEDYHQDYYANNSGQPYCRLVIAPKLKKFQEKFAAKSR
jgi:peptide-methionine (S)-S-oxide reductase